MDGLHLVPVATGLSDFEAKLLAAQLGSDGILWQTRGIVDSIYPFGGIDVLVPTDQLDDARTALAAMGERLAADGAVPAGRDSGSDAGSGSGAGTRASWWLGVAAVSAVVAVVMVRVLSII